MPLTKRKLKHIKVKSSHVFSIAHDGNDILEVTYKAVPGKHGEVTWQYKPITRAQYDSLMKAESKGKWLHLNVRKNERIKGSKIGE